MLCLYLLKRILLVIFLVVVNLEWNNDFYFNQVDLDTHNNAFIYLFNLFYDTVDSTINLNYYKNDFNHFIKEIFDPYNNDDLVDVLIQDEF